jgi:hypothetical protein
LYNRKKKQLSYSFLGLVLSKKFSPVNLEINKAKYTMLPVAINKTQTVARSGKINPENPTNNQAIIPESGVAKN